MKKTLERMVNAGKEAVKGIGRFVKRHAREELFALALASSLVMVNKTEAKYIEGYVAITHNVENLGGSNVTGIDFIEGASYGWDRFDHAYYELPFPDDAHVKAVGSIEGREAESVALPPLIDTAGSSASESFSGSIVVNDGRSVTLTNAPHYLTWSISGLEGCSVYVNGVNARTNSRLDFENLTGEFPEGEHSTASWNVSVEYVRTNGGDPNNPDPNQPIVVNAPGRLLIDNVHKKSPTSTFFLIHKVGASDEPNDSGDKEYIIQGEVTPPYIVSQVLDKKTGQYKYLTTDVRSPDTNEPVFFQQRIHSDFGFARISGGDTNALVFSIPEDTTTSGTTTNGVNKKFGDRVITFQEIYRTDPNDPNFYEEGSKVLVRDLIEEDSNGLGVYLLPDLERKIPSGAIHDSRIEFFPTRALAMADFDRNGRVDANDCSMLEGALGYVGTSMYDIASPDVNDPNILYIGTRPDGKVDASDAKAFGILRAQDEERRGVYDAAMGAMNERVLEAVKETYDEVVGE